MTEKDAGSVGATPRRIVGLASLPREHVAGMMGHVGMKLSFAASLFLDLYRERLARLPLTPPRVLALHIVATQPGLEQKALASALSINQASAMAVVDSLESVGFLRREQGRNRRSKALFLTGEGETALMRALEIERALTDEILKFATDSEIGVLAAMLDRIRERGEEIASTEALAGI